MRRHKKNKKIKNINDIFKDYDSIVNEYKLSQPEETQDKINILQKEAHDLIVLRIKNDKITALILLLIFIISFIFVILADKEIGNLQHDIVEKKNIIAKLQWSDSLFNQLMNVRLDSQETTRTTVVYRVRNGKAVTYDELGLQNDSLSLENVELKQKLDLIQRQYHITFKKINKYITIDAPQLDSLSLENIELKQKLDLIQRRYHIIFKEINNYITINAPQLDSALLLLPYYRDKLKYDAKKQSWIIYFEKE